MLKKIVTIITLVAVLTAGMSINSLAKTKEVINPSIMLDNHLVGVDGDVSTTFRVYVRTLRVYFTNEGTNTINCKLDRPEIPGFNAFYFTLKPGEYWIQNLSTCNDFGGSYKFSAQTSDGTPVEVYARVRQNDEQ